MERIDQCRKDLREIYINKIIYVRKLMCKYACVSTKNRPKKAENILKRMCLQITINAYICKFHYPHINHGRQNV